VNDIHADRRRPLDESPNFPEKYLIESDGSRSRDFRQLEGMGDRGKGKFPHRPVPAGGDRKVQRLSKEPFQRLVILGESTGEGGPWFHAKEDRYADVLVRLINSVQEKPIEYLNKGIGNNSLSPRSPGYG
jgi:hypothetical protein